MKKEPQDQTFSSPDETMGILGNSVAIQQVRETIRQVAPTNIPVLIEGESGTGKELVARALHEYSPWRNKTMFTVNCGAIPEGILESELFGHQRGAFTGAVESRKGYFELAHESTLFLDEIGEMPLTTQVKVLRVLEEKEFMRVGGSNRYQVTVRIVAASNKSLEELVRAGNFRQDLYFRLHAVKIILPPLRERSEDIPLLIDKFQTEFCQENQINFAGFTDDAIEILQMQPWLGNVRELRNFIQSLIVLKRGQRIDSDILQKHLPSSVDTDHQNLPVPTHITVDQAERELIYRILLELKSDMDQIKQVLLSQFMQPKFLKEWRSNMASQPIHSFEEVQTDEEIKTLEEVERDLIKKTLEKTNWNKRKTAQLLGISERTLYRKINDYNLQ
jgi:DNA-binding NtrC family response regulator